MAIQLTAEARAALSEVLESGQFEDESEAVERGIFLLRAQTRKDQLKASIQEGFAAIRRGEGRELNDELWDELYRRGDEAERQERLNTSL